MWDFIFRMFSLFDETPPAEPDKPSEPDKTDEPKEPEPDEEPDLDLDDDDDGDDEPEPEVDWKAKFEESEAKLKGTVAAMEKRIGELTGKNYSLREQAKVAEQQNYSAKLQRAEAEVQNLERMVAKADEDGDTKALREYTEKLVRAKDSIAKIREEEGYQSGREILRNSERFGLGGALFAKKHPEIVKDGKFDEENAIVKRAYELMSANARDSNRIVTKGADGKYKFMSINEEYDNPAGLELALYRARDEHETDTVKNLQAENAKLKRKLQKATGKLVDPAVSGGGGTTAPKGSLAAIEAEMDEALKKGDNKAFNKLRNKKDALLAAKANKG